MIEINTPRLRLIGLHLEELKLLSSQPSDLLKSLRLNGEILELQDKAFTEEFFSALNLHVIPGIIEFPHKWEWYTTWLVIHFELNQWIGCIGLSGFPNENHETQLGYFIDHRFERKGFATESVKFLTAHFLRKYPLLKIVASTHKAHIASQKVLEHNGFRFLKEEGEENIWQMAQI